MQGAPGVSNRPGAGADRTEMTATKQTSPQCDKLAPQDGKQLFHVGQIRREFRPGDAGRRGSIRKHGRQRFKGWLLMLL